MDFAPLNLTASSIIKEINVLKSLILETQTVLDRGAIKLLHDKALNTVNLLAHGEIFLRKDELEKKLNNQFGAFSAANDATILFLTELLNAKEQVLTSYLKDDQDFINRIKNILHRFTDFKYPALMVGKDYLSLSDNIVSNDQLYVLFPEAEASHFDLLYNPVYVNSIRKYFYKNNNTNIFAALPENQFSLITSTVFEDTLPDSQIVDYFKSIKSLLRPGGCLFFTFFDYTNVASFELVEQITQAGSNIMDPDVVLPAIRFYDDYKRIIEGLGMSIDMLVQGNTHNLMVVRKDGELKSIKAKKVIGEIITV